MKKLSFSIASKSKTSSSSSSSESEASANNTPEYITVFETSQPRPPPPTATIPPLQNTWNPHRQSAQSTTGSDDSSAALSEEERVRLEVGRLPDDRGMEEFRDVGVEEFGRAVLKGYGWRDGIRLGRKSGSGGDVSVFQPKCWVGTNGLGSR